MFSDKPHLSNFKEWASKFDLIGLHISSGFYRKGPDIIANIAKHFDGYGKVGFVVKTFHNPENLFPKIFTRDIENVFLIYDEFSNEEIAELSSFCHFGVFPSRGEGFLMPGLDLLGFKKPVFTSGFGGQTEYLPLTSAMSVPYSKQKSNHMSLAHH